MRLLVLLYDIGVDWIGLDWIGLDWIGFWTLDVSSRAAMTMMPA